MTLPLTQEQREYQKFIENSNGDVAVNVTATAPVPVNISQNYIERVQLGLVAGASILNINGSNEDVDTSANEDVTELGGDYQFMEAADAITFVSDNVNDAAGGSGAIVLLIEGLAETTFEFQDEVIILDGLTPVSTANNYERFNSVRVVGSGSSKGNEGTITGTADGKDVAIIRVNSAGESENRFFTSHYSVPANTTALVYDFLSSIGRVGGSGSRFGFVFSKVIFNGTNTTQLGAPTHLSTTGTTSIQTHVPFAPIPEKSDIIFRADANTNNSVFTVSYNILLRENS